MIVTGTPGALVCVALGLGLIAQSSVDARRPPAPAIPEIPRQGDAINLLKNGDASRGFDGWTAGGSAIVEVKGQATWFALRDGARLQQEIPLTASAAGQFLVIVAHGSSERVNEDRAITGLPYLYGTVLSASRHRILAYLQGQQMLGQATAPNAWVTMYGVFRLPEGGDSVVIQLRQAERAGMPQNGSVARFDDVAAYLTASAADASSVLTSWRRLTPAPVSIEGADATESRPNPK